MGLDVKKRAKGPSWLLHGKAAEEALATEERIQAQQQAARSRLWNFRLAAEETAQITFLDGDLVTDGPSKGIMNLPLFWAHNIFRAGLRRYDLIPCLAPENVPGGSCPLCDSGDKSFLCGVLTVIDHREIVGRRRTYKDQKKLFIARRSTIHILRKLADRHEGLAGTTWEVYRSTNRTPNVGDQFLHIEKRSMEEIAKLYEDTAPADVEKEIQVYTEADLRHMGIVGGPPTSEGEDPFA